MIKFNVNFLSFDCVLNIEPTKIAASRKYKLVTSHDHIKTVNFTTSCRNREMDYENQHYKEKFLILIYALSKNFPHKTTRISKC